MATEDFKMEILVHGTLDDLQRFSIASIGKKAGLLRLGGIKK